MHCCKHCLCAQTTIRAGHNFGSLSLKWFSQAAKPLAMSTIGIGMALTCLLLVGTSPIRAGEVYDRGTAHRVPSWAIGPLLLVPTEKIDTSSKADAVRVGTIQSKSVELFGRRFRLAKISLSEVPNNSVACFLETEQEATGHYEVSLSQSLGDQTYYHVMVTWVPADGSKVIQQPQYTVWDVKSRKHEAK